MKPILSDPIVFLSATRTPMGNLQGDLSSLTAHQLGATAIRGAITQAGIAPQAVEELVFGCVLPAGQGQAPARQAALGAGLALSAGCTTINKMCGSGMRAVMTAHDGLAVGAAEVMVAGGMESMSQAPYLVMKGRGGYRLGHATLYDHMMLDGLEDAYEKGRSMGTFGEDCARTYGFTRAMQDDFAIASVQRAQKATASGHFAHEITPVEIQSRKGTVVVSTDEGPRSIKVEKIPELKPAFSKDGTVTAASSSSISDGAAALVMTRLSVAERLGLEPLAKMVGHSTYAAAPPDFPTAPIGAIQRLLSANNWAVADVDLWEVNEAFAVVAMSAMKDLGIGHDQMNIHGGACALGHPIGASGARILVTLLHALRHSGAKRGLASLCIGGGEATAVGIEMF
ncbi:MAG: acetyl-CoA C-acyltransferase [Betaproteobacteria bacterium]|nr:acetyl-CoA C-acyltransferase [Betaproteobacteria bacterium]